MKLVYDSECGLCLRFKQSLERLDSKKTIQFLDANDKETFQKLPFLNQQSCLEIVHLVDKKGNVFTGGEVITELLNYFPQVNKFAWLLDNEQGKAAMDLFYGQLNRMRLMQKKNCFRCGTKKKNLSS